MYTIKEASQRTGVSVALLRAWERRYGIVAPVRTDAGYRLYDDVAIARIRAMRSLVADGWSPRQAAERVASTPAPIDRADPRRLPRGDGGVIGDEAGRLVAAAARIDGPAIEAALDEIFAMGTFERVLDGHLYPALVSLGEAWARGEVDVAGEHAASAAALRRLGMAFEAAGYAGDGSAPVLVGLPPGARHELPALGFATALRRAGIGATYLGPDVPLPSWVTAVEGTRARAAVIGVGMVEDVPGAASVIAGLRGRHPDLAIAVGGRHGAELLDGSVVLLPDPIADAVSVLRGVLPNP